jgi:hypothetical protein
MLSNTNYPIKKTYSTIGFERVILMNMKRIGKCYVLVSYHSILVATTLNAEYPANDLLERVCFLASKPECQHKESGRVSLKNHFCLPFLIFRFL